MNNKILNKKKFSSGVTFLILSMLLIILIITKFNDLNNFKIMKLIITTIPCILLGTTEVYRSLNKKCTDEDIKNYDERELLIILKSRDKSFSITFSISLIIITICLISLALTKNYLFGEILIGISIIPIIMIVSEILCYSYYKKHN